MTREAPIGVQVTKAKKGFGARAWRWTVNAVVILFLFAGFMQVIGQPVLRALSGPTVTPPASTVDTLAAQSVAVTAVTDWLTYNPQDNTAYRANVTDRFTSGDTVNAWSGSAWMAPDIVTAGAVVQQPDVTATVEVTARVRIATPDQPSQKPGTERPDTGTPANNSTLPGGWKVADTQWLHLVVPIVVVEGQPAAAGTGPVFATSNPELTVTPGVNGDTDATTSSKQWATSLFTALAGTDPTALAYLTTTPIEPLNGQVTLTQVGSWEVLTTAEGETSHTATGIVTWQLPAADLQVKQLYTVELTDQGGRWAAATVTATTGGTE